MDNNKVIEIRNLNYTYHDGTSALKDVSLDVFEGDSIGLIGSNGAGKSTFLLHLNGILKGNGYLKIFGYEVKDKNLPAIRSRVGMVFQNPDMQLFMPTVEEDVAFGPVNMNMSKRDVQNSVANALTKVDMFYALKRTSHHLSFGEKKRISIATVLSMGPKMLVLDEPSSNLDPKHRKELINLLEKIKITKIIASHDLGMIRKICTRVVLLNNGKIISSGNTKDILNNRELLETHFL